MTKIDKKNASEKMYDFGMNCVEANLLNILELQTQVSHR